MTQASKTFGDCQLCGKHGTLTQQHIRLVPELKGHKIMICRSCHEIVSRYEDEVRRIVEQLRP